MTIELNNETLTKYVLDELQDEERQAVEAALEQDEQARKTAKELRAAARLTSEAYREEPVLVLRPEQRATVAQEAATRPRRPARERKRRSARVRMLGGLAMAAGLLFVAGLLVLPALQPARESARRATPENLRKQMELTLRMAGQESSDPYWGTAVCEYREEAKAFGMQDEFKEFAGKMREMGAGASPYNDPDLNYWPGHNTEAYDHLVDNAFLDVRRNPLSTFSIDVDTASYANVRRFLNEGMLPPKDSVRIEEMVNYFDYDYAPPEDGVPFSAHVLVGDCPWTPEHRLARIGLKGWEMARDERPRSNLVFLIDVSGSMQPLNKLPLLKQAMALLVHGLGERDSVAMVVYAGSSGLVLPATPGNNKNAMLEALGRLGAGGSTHGSAGIQLAYEVASQHFVEGGVNRVILATDGDFNVGVTNQGDLVRLIEEKAKSGIFLTVLGFGMGNLKDSTMEQLADKGNGNYAYIDTLAEAKKVLVEEMSGTLVTIAKDVKIQVEFNPARVAAYRLIGYENRILAAEDFNDDAKDAGEIGAGHTVTALYELAPAGQDVGTPGVDALKYQQDKVLTDAAGSREVFTLKIRYKEPEGDTSKLLEFPVTDGGLSYAGAPDDYRFAAQVASFGMLLRGSKYKGGATFDSVLELAEEGLGADAHGYRAEFLDLVRKAKSI